MRLSILLAAGSLVVATLLALLTGLSWPWALIIGGLAAFAGLSIGMKLFVERQHQGHSKNSVLRNATVQVHAIHEQTVAEFRKSIAELRYDQGLAKTGDPDAEEIRITGNDSELEDTRVLSGDGDEPGPDAETPSGILYDSDFPPNSRFFVADITVEPTEKSTGGHTHYEPDALELVIPQSLNKPITASTDPQTAPATLVGVEVHNGARFLPAEEKLTGTQRLRIHFVVTDPKAGALKLSYYFEQFGHLSLNK
jgi:hypothetical protein